MDEVFELDLGHYGDALGVAWPREFRRVSAAVDPRDLSGGERYHTREGIVAVHHVEVVEIAPRGAHDHHSLLPHRDLPLPATRLHLQTGSQHYHSTTRILNGWGPFRKEGAPL